MPVGQKAYSFTEFTQLSKPYQWKDASANARKPWNALGMGTVPSAEHSLSAHFIIKEKHVAKLQQEYAASEKDDGLQKP